jgi:hypothetical protein
MRLMIEAEFHKLILLFLSNAFMLKELAIADFLTAIETVGLGACLKFPVLVYYMTT